MWKKTSLLCPNSSPHPSGIGVGTREGASGAPRRDDETMPPAKKLIAEATRKKTAVHLPRPAARWFRAGVSKRGLRGEGVRRGGVSRRREGDGELADMAGKATFSEGRRIDRAEKTSLFLTILSLAAKQKKKEIKVCRLLFFSLFALSRSLLFLLWSPLEPVLASSLASLALQSKREKAAPALCALRKRDHSPHFAPFAGRFSNATVGVKKRLMALAFPRPLSLTYRLSTSLRPLKRHQQGAIAALVPLEQAQRGLSHSPDPTSTSHRRLHFHRDCLLTST